MVRQKHYHYDCWLLCVISSYFDISHQQLNKVVLDEGRAAFYFTLRVSELFR